MRRPFRLLAITSALSLLITVSCSSPFEPTDEAWIDISVGAYAACAITGDLSLECWGSGDLVDDAPIDGEFGRVSVGNSHACAIQSDGEVSCWGMNETEQAEPKSGVFMDISVGHSCHASLPCSCGITVNGTLKCWGGEGPYMATFPPRTYTFVDLGYTAAGAVTGCSSAIVRGVSMVDIDDEHSGSFVEIASGFEALCGLEIDGGVTCWGPGDDGQHYDPPDASFSSISMGATSVCGVMTDTSEVLCWGWYIPSPDSEFVEVSVGNEICGITVGDEIVCWNYNGISDDLVPPF